MYAQTHASQVSPVLFQRCEWRLQLFFLFHIPIPNASKTLCLMMLLPHQRPYGMMLFPDIAYALSHPPHTKLIKDPMPDDVLTVPKALWHDVFPWHSVNITSLPHARGIKGAMSDDAFTAHPRMCHLILCSYVWLIIV